MRTIPTGLIGYGMAGSVFHAPLIAVDEGLHLAAIASSRTADIARDFPESRAYATPQALIDAPDIELVVIATPNDTHADLARRALEAGKHVVVDKPFTLDSAEAEALIAVAERHGRLLSVFQNRRWDGDFLTVKRFIEDGRLGEVYHYEAHFDRFRPEIKAGWREEPAPGAGVLYDLGAHLIDQALRIFGMPKALTADVMAQRAQAQVPDYFHLVLHYGRRRVVLHSSTLVREPGPRYIVHGDAGSFAKFGIDGQEAALKAGMRPAGDDWGRDRPEYFGRFVDNEGTEQIVETLPGRYPEFYAGVAQAITEGGPLPVTAREARDTIMLIEAAMRSAKEGRTVVI
ncbi:MAG TPA: oxidoreductase [Luteibacter sp.]|jgi:scyllo-inositol 2-dehydrogenase (NADP+)|nr:oxidoreductase [Luteibacter sp.]